MQVKYWEKMEKIYKMMTSLPSFLELHLVYLHISAAFPNHAKATLRPMERKVEMCVWQDIFVKE